MNNKVKFLVALPLTAMLLTSCGGSSKKIPTFPKSGGMRFAAYSGPTVARWSGSSDNPDTLTPENLIKISEAGFDKIIALYEGATTAGGDTYTIIEKRSEKAMKDANHAMDAIESEEFKAKAPRPIKYYVRDWSFYGLVKNYLSGYSPNITEKSQYEEIITKMFDDTNTYMVRESYGGNFCHDEPYYGEIAKIADQVEIYNRVMKEKGLKGEPLVNLFPGHVGSIALEGHTYEEYVDEFFRLIAPQVGYVSYDFYPLLSNFYDGSYVRNTYLYNLNLMAKKCKATRDTDHPVELRTFMQSVGNWTGMRDMTGIGDFRFQIYCNMAFGSHEITYYEYANSKSPQEGGFALFNLQTNEYNWTFDLAAKVNNEVHNFEDAYLSFDWDGVMYKNADEMYENQAFDLLADDAIQKHPRVSIKSCEQDTLMGTFKNKKGEDAFMVVNYTDPYKNLNNEVKLHFKKASKLLMYRMGEPMIVDLPLSGNYTLKLYPGEGRFIIPIK